MNRTTVNINSLPKNKYLKQHAIYPTYRGLAKVRKQ